MIIGEFINRITIMIEQVDVENLPIFADNSIVEIGVIQQDLRPFLYSLGFKSYIFQYDLDEADVFILKLEKDYFWMYMFKNVHENNPPTIIATTRFTSAQISMKILLEALHINQQDMPISIFEDEIQYVSLQNLLNLQ